MQVIIPSDNIAVRTYAVEALLTGHLEIPVEVVPKAGASNYTLQLPNGNSLVIADAFFNQFPEELSYLSEANIPETVHCWKHALIGEQELPGIFCDKEGQFEVQENRILCPIDLFASTFFMLSRWEEHVVAERDRFERFPEKRALAIRAGFWQRPVVNEYAQLLATMLQELGFELPERQRSYAVWITHDVDGMRRYPSLKSVLRAMAGDLKAGRPGLMFRTWRTYWASRTGKAKDPYDTFELLMDHSEKHGLTSRFYFIPGKSGEEDLRYNIDAPEARSAIKTVLERKHVVGIHGSWTSWNDETIFRNETDRLKEVAGQPIEEGRQHYLKFRVPDTWQQWEDNGYAYDSSLGYSETAGFRCGTCYPFQPFNIRTQKKLELQEVPLVAMETALYQEYRDLDQFCEVFTTLAEEVKKYDGTYVFLWHNNNINHRDWERFFSVYDRILSAIAPAK